MRDDYKEALRQNPISKMIILATTVDGYVSKMICQLWKQQIALDIDVDIFIENLINFHYFEAVSNENMETKMNDPREKLTQLIRNKRGRAKEMTRNRIQLPARVSWEIWWPLQNHSSLKERKLSIGPKSKLVMLLHIRNSKTSWKSLTILVTFRFEMCWIQQVLLACYCKNDQTVLETNMMRCVIW